jgi:hypothetical protein
MIGNRSRIASWATTLAAVGCLVGALFCSQAVAQSDCADGNGVLNMDPPKSMTVPDLIQKFTAEETKVKAARAQYTYTQDLMAQTLGDKGPDGQYHEVTAVSYNAQGKREEKVTFAEQSTLRGINLTKEDMDDVREFMPLILTTQDLPEYNLTYAGQQHVDDLDTYIFHVVPKKIDKNRRYFQGKIWVDGHDLEIVKVCGKSVPELIHTKRGEHQDLRPTFVSYRQPVGEYWFPAFVKVDDSLYFKSGAVHIKEIVKFTGYKKAGAAAAKP